MIKKTAYYLLCLSLFLLFPVQHVSSNIEAQYQKAKRAYSAMDRSPSKKKLRDNWMKVIYMFSDISEQAPTSNRADDACYMVGILYQEMYQYSFLNEDLDRAIEAFRELTIKHPESNLADDGQFLIGKIYEEKFKDLPRAYKEYQRVLDVFPHGDMAPAASERVDALSKYALKQPGRSSLRMSRATISEIRHWSDPSYTRIAIYANRKVQWEHHSIRSNSLAGRTDRLYVDLSPATIKPGLNHSIFIDDGLLTRVRIAQNTPEKVRVVLDIKKDVKKIESVKIISHDDPFRVILDISSSGDSGRKKSVLNTIVIDPGHGGKDPGAVGPGGIKEKDVVLKIALKLAEKLRKELGVNVVLTRSRDVFIDVEQRPAIANSVKADLFISIHANASPRKDTFGIETYYLSPTVDPESLRVAALENATTQEKLTDLQLILKDLIITENINESSMLAGAVQDSLVSTVSIRYSKIKSLGVKYAPFYVLMNAEMPCILAEVSFISNKREVERLNSPVYQSMLAEGILKGVERYARQMKGKGI